MAKAFDTYKSSVELQKFIDVGVPPRHMIIAACKDDCVTNLSQSCKQWFVDMGSDEIMKLQYRQGWAFIGITGAKQMVERVSTEKL